MRAKGITAPIFPGIMPLNAYGGFKRMTRFCKTRIPPAMAAKVSALSRRAPIAPDMASCALFSPACRKGQRFAARRQAPLHPRKAILQTDPAP